jgi:hypothetical protein
MERVKMKKMKLAMLAAAALVFTSQASAQEDLIEYLVDACETELVSFCSTVTPGEGRLLHCAAAHADQLSGQCEYALYQAATLLEQFAAATAYVINSCRTDIETHCSAVAMGEGRLLMCLDENSAEVSDSCKQAVADTIAE